MTTDKAAAPVDFAACRCDCDDPMSVVVQRADAPHQLRGELYLVCCKWCGFGVPFIAQGHYGDSVMPEAITLWNAAMQAAAPVGELLPCPFCGHPDVTNDEGCFPLNRDRTRWEVRCGNPNCYAHEQEAPTHAEAVAKWNRRAAAPVGAVPQDIDAALEWLTWIVGDKPEVLAIKAHIASQAARMGEEYERGWRDGYERRHAEVLGALA